ncbi:MAG: tetratricopeptide repeat protein [Deltaproteobacteria bacterium]|nr:tetratricopeptide repeat protein [Deltaproteobacteria bacterium]
MVRNLSLFLLLILLFSCSNSVIHKRAKEHNLNAIKLINENKLEMAEKHLELALEYNKNYAEAYNNLGIIYLRQNKPEKAERFFSLAIEYNSDFAEAHNNLGYIYLLKKDYKKAQQRFKSALNIDPSFINARLNLARSYIISGEIDKAESELLKLKLLSGNEDVNSLLVNVYIKTGKISQGFALTDEMVADEKMNSKGLYLRGFLNLTLNRCIDALTDFEKVEKMYSGLMEFIVNYSAALICVRNFEKAENILRKALEIQSDEPAVLFNLGKIEYEKKNFQNAEIYFRKSYESGFIPSCSYLVDTLFTLGRKDESIKISSSCK